MTAFIVVPTGTFFAFLFCVFVSLFFAADVMAFFYAWSGSVWSARLGTAVTLSAVLVAVLCVLGL